MVFKFVYYNLGWWLEVSDFDTLKELEKLIPSKIYSSIKGAIEFENKSDNYNSNDEEAFGPCVAISSRCNGLSYIETANNMFINDLELKRTLLLENKKIYVNRNYGWHINDLSENLSALRLSLDYPIYKRKDILIVEEKLDSCLYYKLYLGDLLVKTKFGIYFKTREEAYHLGELLVDKYKYNLGDRVRELSYYGLEKSRW